MTMREDVLWAEIERLHTKQTNGDAPVIKSLINTVMVMRADAYNDWYGTACIDADHEQYDRDTDAVGCRNMDSLDYYYKFDQVLRILQGNY